MELQFYRRLCLLDNDNRDAPLIHDADADRRIEQLQMLDQDEFRGIAAVATFYCVDNNSNQVDETKNYCYCPSSVIEIN